MGVLGLVVSAAGGSDDVCARLVRPAVAAGWTVAVTATPTAGRWLAGRGEAARIAAVTGLPVRSEPRLPWEVSPHPEVDCWLAAPVTANTVVKLALGIADNQALTHLCEAVGSGSVPVVLAPQTNAEQRAHPAWAGHLRTLTAAGVLVVSDPTAALAALEGLRPDR